MADESNEVAEAAEEATGKEAIYIALGEHVQNKTGKRIGKTGGREIFDMVVNSVFALATQEGTIRLNGGFGSFHVKDYQAGKRRLPSGEEVEFGERQKLRYEEGVVVKELVSNGGNLEEALKVRGSRAKTEEPAAAPAAKENAADAAENVELD